LLALLRGLASRVPPRLREAAARRGGAWLADESSYRAERASLSPAEVRALLGQPEPPTSLCDCFGAERGASARVVASSLCDCAEARASCSSFLSGPPIEVVLKLACVPLAFPLALALLLLWRVLPAAARLAGSVLLAACRAVHAGWVAAVEWVATHCKRCVYALVDHCCFPLSRAVRVATAPLVAAAAAALRLASPAARALRDGTA
ncbi:hypothetical protein EMIHUDRAFT_124709, partial [Emiliania huxleyi CCMP1516]